MFKVKGIYLITSFNEPIATVSHGANVLARHTCENLTQLNAKTILKGSNSLLNSLHRFLKVEKAGTTDVDKVADAMIGIEVPNMTGGMATMLPNHHLTKPVLIGEIQADGQFETVWQTDDLVPGDAWSDYLPGSKDIEADWVNLKCGNYNTVTKKCSGQNYE